MIENTYNKTRRYSLPEKLVTEGTSRVIVLENIPEKDDEDILENCGIPKIMVCHGRAKSDSQDKKCKKVLIKKSPPNGGSSAWLIVLASFLAGFCIDGTCYSFGIFYDSFLKHFQSSKGLTALSGALISGVYQTTGPIASALIHKFGCRKVTIAGGLITAFSLYASAFTDNIYFHLLTYGVLSGIGLGLMYLPAIVTVSSYFTSRRSLATGVSLCGSGLGAFFYAPSCQYLIDHLSLESSVCILALIIAVIGLFCGVLQAPLEQVISLVFEEEDESTEETNKNQINDRLTSRIDENDENEEDNSKSEEKLDQARRNNKRKNNLYVHAADFHLKGRKNGQRAISECVAPNLAILEPSLRHHDPSDPNYRSTYMYRSKNSLIFKQQDIFYSGSTLHLQPQTSVLNIPNKPNKLNFDDNISDIVTVKTEKANTVYQTIKKWCSNNKGEPSKEPVTEEKQRKMTSVEDEDESGLKIVKEMLDIKLFKESTPFLLLTIGNFASMLGFYIPFIYLSQHVEQTIYIGNRLTMKSECALLLSFIGITNTFARLVFGVLADQIKKGTFRSIPILNRLTIMSLNNYSLFLAGICIIFIPFSKFYYQIVIICLVFGVCIASAMCLTSIILVDLLGLEKLTNSFALIALVRGIASIVGPPLFGILYDYTGSFDYTFYLAGIMFILSSVFCFLVKVKESAN